MSLATGVVEAYQLNERTGYRYGAVGGNTLVDTNGVARIAGKVSGTYGARFVAASSQHLTRLSTASLSMGDASAGWWVWVWVRFASLPAANQRMGLLSKQDSSVGNEWSLSLFNNSGSIYQLACQVAAPDNSSVTASLTVTPDTTGWHLAEAWYDPVTAAVYVAWDGGAPASAAKSVAGTRAAKADLFLGAVYNSTGFLNGDLNAPTIRKQPPGGGERAAVWNGGNGTIYPFPPSALSGITNATLDNSSGSSPIAAGAPLPLALPPSFSWDKVYWANGDDLTARDANGNPLTLWPDTVDRSNKYGRVWIAAPAGGIAAGASAPITVRSGDPAQFSTTNYDTLFTKRSPDANTVALYHCDSGTTTTPEASGGTALGLTGSPSFASTDGGNFKSRNPSQAFAAGKHLIFDGSSQYATVAGLLDSPPAAGCVSFWFRLDSTPADGARLFSKIASFTGSTVNDGIELFAITASKFTLRVTNGGVATDANIDYLSAIALGQWFHAVCSWGPNKIQLWLSGVKATEAPHSGAWANGSAAALCFGAKLFGSAANYCPMSIDEIEIRNVEPTRTDVLTWYARGAPPRTWDHDRWTRNPSNPLLGATLTAEQGVVFEPRLVRKAAGDWVGLYTGGNLTASLFGMTSVDGKALTKTNTKVLGNGAGGWSGDACRGQVLRDADGTLYAYFSDAIGTVGGSIHYATTTDGGLTWTHQGVLMAPDSGHTGWANTSVVRVGSTYHWILEFTGGPTQYSSAYFTSTSPTGPLTLVDDELLFVTMRPGIAAVSSGGLIHDGTRFHLFPHCGKFASLPTAIYHHVSEDCRRWLPVGSIDPVFDLEEQSIIAHQDQSADAFVYALPDTGQVGVLYDIDDNHGGGLQAKITGAYFTGTLADLNRDYPRGVIGAPVVSGAPGQMLRRGGRP